MHDNGMSGTMRGWFAALVLLGCGALPASAAEPTVRIVGTELRAPPDSHEPQRALVSLHNAGVPAAGLTLACTFQDEGGRPLDTAEAPVRDMAEGASAVMEVIYYGWPRASRAACRLTGHR